MTNLDVIIRQLLDLSFVATRGQPVAELDTQTSDLSLADLVISYEEKPPSGRAETRAS